MGQRRVECVFSLHTVDVLATPPGDVTELLRAWGQGDEQALAALLPLVERELRRLARAYMSRERQDHTLQTTALVNEAFMRLADASRLPWQSRAHFFGIAARLMRRVLVDYARSRGYQKRGGHIDHIALDEAVAVTPPLDFNVVALDHALEKLTALDERKGRVIELRFFGGLSVDETAEVLGVSADTVKRDWRLAKLWLLRELASES